MRLLWASLVVLPTAACVLVVPPIDHSAAHCQINGAGANADAGACATCLRTSCQPSIDACCNDGACAGDDGHAAILDALDACSAGDAQRCASGIGNGQSAAAGAVRGCVAGTCKTACLGDAAVKIDWSCAAARTTDNECSACVYDKCGPALDECCGDSSCSKSSDLASDMGACTGGDKPGCTFLLTKSDSGFEGKARACITKQCATACMSNRPHQQCSLQSGGTSCSCTQNEKSQGPDCSVAQVGGNCVLGKKGCTCGPYTCTDTSSGSLGSCSCSFGGDGSSTRCNAQRTASEGRCCLKRGERAFTCECLDYLSSCSETSGEYSVPTCNVGDALAGLANVLVTKCSN